MKKYIFILLAVAFVVSGCRAVPVTPQINQNVPVQNQNASTNVPVPPQEESSACKDVCGNGVCEEIVCLAIGCPCAESQESCPQDCA